MPCGARTQAVDDLLTKAVLPALSDFVRNPALSRFCDAAWEEKGDLYDALKSAAAWAQALLPDAKTEISAPKGVPPCLFVEVPGTREDAPTVLAYGHLDKQPPSTDWDEGLGAYEPVLRDGKLFGRGAADDGYAFYTTLAAYAAARKTGDVPRLVGLFETDEESGSRDFAQHLEHFASRVGSPELVLALDLGCENYDELWCTQSLRGIVSVRARVAVLEHAAHSGAVSGAVPSSMRIWRLLLDRLEDAASGRVKVEACRGPMPEHLKEAFAAAGERALKRKLPLLTGVSPQGEAAERFAAMAWEPTLSVLGADGLPACAGAAAVVRPFTTLALSLRISPTANAQAALEAVKRALTTDVPCGAQVTIEAASATPGFCAPAWSPALERAIRAAADRHFKGAVRHTFEGGSIGVLALLQKRYPNSGFLLTGLLGPGSNAHGPNESLDIGGLKRMSALVADLFADFGEER